MNIKKFPELTPERIKQQNLDTVTNAMRFNNKMARFLDALKGRDIQIKNLWTTQEFAMVNKMPLAVAHDMIFTFTEYGLLEAYENENKIKFYKFSFMDRVQRLKNNTEYYKEKILEWQKRKFKNEQLIKHLEG